MFRLNEMKENINIYMCRRGFKNERFSERPLLDKTWGLWKWIQPKRNECDFRIVFEKGFILGGPGEKIDSFGVTEAEKVGSFGAAQVKNWVGGGGGGFTTAHTRTGLIREYTTPTPQVQNFFLPHKLSLKLMDHGTKEIKRIQKHTGILSQL